MTTRPISTFTIPATAAAGRVWHAFVERILAAGRTVGTRRTLLEMDARMLKDIGITHADAVAEARRLPWDLTPRRR
jgi:hypothetical protein